MLTLPETWQLLPGVSLVCKRWDRQTRTLFQESWNRGKRTHQLWSLAPGQGGKPLGTATLTAPPRVKLVRYLTKEELKAAGGKCQTPRQFANEYCGGKIYTPVTLVSFEFEAIAQASEERVQPTQRSLFGGER